MPQQPGICRKRPVTWLEASWSLRMIETHQSNDVLPMGEKTDGTKSRNLAQEEKKSLYEHSLIEPEGTTTLTARASRRFDDKMLKVVLQDEEHRIVSSLESDGKYSIQEQSRPLQEDGDHEEEEQATKELSGTPVKSVKETIRRMIQVAQVPTPQIIDGPSPVEQTQQYSPFNNDLVMSNEYFQQFHGSDNGTDVASMALSVPSRTSTPATYEGNRYISPISRDSLQGAHHSAMTSTARHGIIMSPAEGHQNAGLLYTQGEVEIPHLPPLSLPLHASHVPRPANSYHALPIVSNDVMSMAGGGKRRINLLLVEDKTSTTMEQPERSSFLSFRRPSILRNPIHPPIREEVASNPGRNQWINHGSLTISWYEGTSSLELQEHVRNSVIHKLGLMGTSKLADFRVLDASTDPPEGVFGSSL
jgi:hypothetical protein